MKTKINKAERLLKNSLNKILNYSALYLPTIENPELYKIPDPIFKFYKNQFDNDDLDIENIEIIYTTTGELFGYCHIDNERQITFVLFRSENVSNQIFALKNISDNLSNEKDYNIAIRGILLPNHVFYDNYISDELLDKYKGYKCDVCFYNKFDTYRGCLLLDNKLIHYFERPFLINYLDKSDLYSHDLFFDFRKYDKLLKSDVFIDSIYDKYLDIFKTDSFFRDKKPIRNDGKVNNYATDVVTDSYYGYNRICFILPEVSNNEVKLFLNKTLFKIIDEIKIDKTLFLERIRFYKCIENDDKTDKIYDSSIHFVENEKTRVSTKFIEYSNDDIIRLFLTTS